LNGTHQLLAYADENIDTVQKNTEALLEEVGLEVYPECHAVSRQDRSRAKR
jgi:hypothetical protein